MHEQIALIQVTLDKSLILLSIFSRYDQEILRADKPIKFLKPKYLSHTLTSLLMLLPMLDDLFYGMCLSILDSNIRSSLCL
jgi:hypothetical protein